MILSCHSVFRLSYNHRSSHPNVCSPSFRFLLQRHQGRLFLNRGPGSSSMNQERMSTLQSIGFVFDVVGTKWEENFAQFTKVMLNYGSFDKIPCPKKMRKEDFSLEELATLHKVRRWIRVSRTQQGWIDFWWRICDVFPVVRLTFASSWNIHSWT